MKQEIIISAKTVEQAIAEGARALNAPEESVSYEILQEPKKGFLGIGELPAKVKVSYMQAPSAVAAQFLKALIEDMEIDAAVTLLEESEDSVRFAIDGEDAGLLIGYHGETLDALQYLTGLAANRREEDEKQGDGKRHYVRVTIDAGGYRDKREETLRSLARRTAAKVRRFKRSVTLGAMNPSDRRVIHSEIQNVEGVTTESVGKEGHRCVVVFLEGRKPSALGAADFGTDGSSRGSRGGNRRRGGRGDSRSYGKRTADSIEGSDSSSECGYSIVRGGSEE